MTGQALVVDDDAGFRELAVQLLTAWGYEVVGQASGVEEALRRVDQERPRVVLADVALPDGSGFDLTEQLLTRDWPMAVVLVSAAGDEGYASAARGVGACGFLAKDQLSRAALHALLQDA